MRTVAERLVLGLTAAAQSDRVFSRRRREGVAKVVDDCDDALYDVRAIFSAANRDGVGHGALLLQDLPFSRLILSNGYSPVSLIQELAGPMGHIRVLHDRRPMECDKLRDFRLKKLDALPPKLVLQGFDEVLVGHFHLQMPVPA
jgi:hypothetical protein